MSIMQSIFGALGANPQQAAPQQAATTTGAGLPGNIPAQAAAAAATTNNAVTAPNGVVPAGSADAPASPLADFADFWNTTSDPNAPTGPQPLFTVDQAKLLESARKYQFAPQITPEAVAAIQAGGEGAVTALTNMLNEVGQQVYARGAFATTQLIDNGLTRGGFARTAEIPGLIRNHSTTSHLQDTNPVFNNPAAQPLVELVKNQLMVKFPNATAAELAQHANQYLTGFASLVTAPQQAAAAATASAGETDWNSFIG